MDVSIGECGRVGPEYFLEAGASAVQSIDNLFRDSCSCAFRLELGAWTL